ncbi:hypothetical protein Moror_4912 [Moniliophthora roreri MCA 2997]|uniref:AB hydrolase-1 domain-containing protein n=2 Tax=Moniliophthora roreri TaxID=221103 RepID=V2WSE3_MONRO|nr:hypothetical protein Moror_4912 [Moniliophthora roreri MCA 2997]KAI3613538.1 hypothetical protein WG66_006169 [Moniliophthora roreri]
MSRLPTILDPTSCAQKGLCPVTTIRKQTDDPLESHSLYYEVHGTGPEKIVLIMGLNSSSNSWFPQVEHFGKSTDYSVLVFDNRGVGNSGVPWGPYTTSGMAEDVIVLLNFIGWTSPRDLHIVGLSLGGMIAQELATRIPERIVSLLLGVTTPGGRPWSNLPPRKGVSSLAKLTLTKDVEKKIPLLFDMLYPSSWLDEVSENDGTGRTNREVEAEHYRKRIEMTPPQSMLGAFSQMSAGLTHHVSDERLRKISADVPKVIIVTGDDDHLVHPQNSFHLKKHMPQAEFIQWKKTGHAIHYQHRKKFNELMRRVIVEGKEKVSNQAVNLS